MSSPNHRRLEVEWHTLRTRYVIDGGRNALEFDSQMTRQFFGHASTEPELVKCCVIGS